MARTADSPEVKAAKALATKVVSKLTKEGVVSDDAAKAAKEHVTAVLAKAARKNEEV